MGQSETAVADMVDTFLLLALARTGDQLQGIKKGILEIADVIAVNKADGPHTTDAQNAARELSGALRLLRGDSSWLTPVLTCSALEGTGVPEVWHHVQAHRAHLESAGALDERRRRQQIGWMWEMAQDYVLSRFRSDPGVRAVAAEAQEQILDAALTPAQAVERMVVAYDRVNTAAAQRP